MEEDIFKSSEHRLKKVLDKRLKTAVNIAQERLEYEIAHNAEMLRALDIVKKLKIMII
jgi:hypothetical protein